MRFDFAYGKPLTDAQLASTQDMVNKQIAAALPVHTQVASLPRAPLRWPPLWPAVSTTPTPGRAAPGAQVSSLALATEVNGLRAVFGEQYPDPVRVVSVGGPGVQQMLDAPKEAEWSEYSVEFCGGTHLATSDEAGAFVLLSEEGLGRGIRRVLGVTFQKAEEARTLAAELASRVAKAGGLQGNELAAEASELARVLEGAVIPATDRKELSGKVSALKKKVVDAGKGNAKANAEAAKVEAEEIAAAAEGKSYVVGLLKAEADAKVVEAACAVVVSKLPEAAVLLLGAGKTACALGVVPKALADKVDAKEWVNAALHPCGGKGGGKPNRAQGAARDASNIAQSHTAALEFVKSKMD